METKQPGVKGRQTLQEIMDDTKTEVAIKGTKRKVRIGWIRPYTIERLTALWVERDLRQTPESTGDTLKSMCIEPYFSIREASLFTLNNAFLIKFFHPLHWRWWAFVREYTEEQVMEIIQEGKKKIPLMSHWMNMAYSVDMRNDWIKMTEKEAEQYRAELLSAVNHLSSRNSQNTEDGDGDSAVTDTDVFSPMP